MIRALSISDARPDGAFGKNFTLESIGMTLAEAKAQARLWWGEKGSADLRTGRRSQRYVVGATNLNARLGGYVAIQYGASWTSFEDAFDRASRGGRGPLTGFEGDDALEDEA